MPVELIEEELVGGLPQVQHWLGVEVADLEGTDPRVARLREALGVTVTAGVMVVAVEADQPGQEAGIRPGDVVVAIEGQEILDLGDYQDAAAMHLERHDPLSFLMRTGTSERYVQVTPRRRGTDF